MPKRSQLRLRSGLKLVQGTLSPLARKETSVVRAIISAPNARPRFASGITQCRCKPSAIANSRTSGANASGSSLLTSVGLKLSRALLPGPTGVRSNPSLMSPLPFGKSSARSLALRLAASAWPSDGLSGRVMATMSHRITPVMLAEIARSNSRSSRFEVIWLVTFRSNCSRFLSSETC